ncbi:MAG: flippase-like domain-containing protein, partial [Acidimicrobiia bacterium]|nr:flippase-like domain-containing protein [Acidimicrobiia bacterium]
GASAPEALSVGVLDSVINTALQAVILIGVPLLGLATLNLDLDISIGGHTRLVIIVVAVVGAAILLTLFVQRLRDLVVPQIHKMASTFAVLRSPHKVLLLVGGNLGAQVGFAFGIWASLHAFGQSATILELLLINAAVSLVAGLLPIPGGIGVSEAGLAAGFVAVGVPSEIAISAAILYRIVSFYLPPIGGFFCLRWLQRNDYL